ncbi:branched-chain amino acid transport system substrate-binding protein [Desulfovibrionales bacterium]
MQAWCKFIIMTIALIIITVSSVAAKTLKIGSLSPLSGPYAADGSDIVNGVLAAIAMVEKEGGIPGYDKIELQAEDDACDPRQAVAGANKLVNSGVVGVIGAYCSSSTIPASEVLADMDIPMITPASTNAKVTERGLAYMFRMCGRDDDQSKVAVKFFTDYLKAKTVFIVDDKTTYSQGMADNAEKLAKERGLQVLYHDHVNEGDKDFSAVLTKVKDQNPDVLYISLQNSVSGALMLLQARRIGVKSTVVAQDAVYHPQLIEIAKGVAEGTYFTFGLIDENRLPYKKFMESYSKYGNPGSYSIYAYDSAYVLLSSIKAAKSIDAKAIKAEIMKYDTEGASANIKFLPNGDSSSNYIIRVVKGGQFVNFWDPATGKTY